MIKIALVIAGCGFLDGSEIYETVFTLLELDRNQVEVSIFAPNKKQHQVINHLTGEKMSEERNVLVESARLARGKIQPLNKLKVKDFDALILPGGSGAMTNLSDLASKKEHGKVIQDLQAIIVQFYQASKPIGALCISPAMVALALKEHASVKITLGKRNALIHQIGAQEEVCSADHMVVDEAHKLVTTPAFMLDAPLSQIHQGISHLVTQVVKMCKVEK